MCFQQPFGLIPGGGGGDGVATLDGLMGMETTSESAAGLDMGNGIERKGGCVTWLSVLNWPRASMPMCLIDLSSGA